MTNEEITNEKINTYSVGNENPVGKVEGKEGYIYIENATIDETSGSPSLYVNTSKTLSKEAWVKIADENCAEQVPHKKVVNNLSELLTNSVNMVDKFYEIFFDPNPHNVELEVYNKEGEILKVQIPNRAKDRSIALSGEGSPEGIIEAFLGALYIDSYNSQLYLKQTEEGNMGWQNITPQPIKVHEEEFTITSSTNKVILSQMVDDNNPPEVYLNGGLIYPSSYEISYDKRTINFNSTFATGSKILVRYIVGLYGLKGETALTCKVGGTKTLIPYAQGYVKNVGTEKDIILDFGLPVGALEWGNITGTLSNQTDLKTALDSKQPNLTAGNHITISSNNTISAVDTWGGITGTLSNQTDLKNALDAKQNNLTAGNHITINNGTISATDAWGGITGTLSNQTDLKNALDAKQAKLTAGSNIKIENNVISVPGELGAQVTMKIWED